MDRGNARERRARVRTNEVADRRRYAAMLRETSRHGGLDPDAARYLAREAERIDREAMVALTAAMREAEAVRA